MQDTTNILNYQRLLAAEHYLEVAVNVNGVLYEGDRIESVDTEGSLFGDEIPAVGNACSRSLTLRMLTPKEDIPLGAMIQLFVRLRTADEYSGWLRKGYYMIISRRRERTADGTDVITEIVANDTLARADVAFPEDASWPMTDAQAWNICKAALGLASDWAPDKGYTIPKIADLTYRKMLQYLAGAYGGNITLGDTGVLHFVPLAKSGSGLPIYPSELYNGIPLPGITMVTVHDMQGKQYTAGAAGRNLDIDCPFATEEMAANILATVGGYSYQPFEASEALIADPALELGDIVTTGGMTERICTTHAVYGAKVVADVSAPEIIEVAHSYSPGKNSGGSRAGRTSNLAIMKANWNSQIVSQVATPDTDADGNELKTEDGNTSYTLHTPKVVGSLTDKSTYGFREEFKNINVGSFQGTTINFGQMLDHLVIDGGLSVLGNLEVYDGNGIMTSGALQAEGALAIGGNGVITGSLLASGGFETVATTPAMKMPANSEIRIGSLSFRAEQVPFIVRGSDGDPAVRWMYVLVGASG